MLSGQSTPGASKARWVLREPRPTKEASALTAFYMVRSSISTLDAPPHFGLISQLVRRSFKVCTVGLERLGEGGSIRVHSGLIYYV
jgi:hypothetical protein